MTATPRRRAVLAVLLLACTANLLYTTTAVGGALGDTVLNRWGQNVALAAAVALCGLRAARPGPDRAAWIALTAGLALWTAGNTVWSAVYYALGDPPFPSAADALWLGFYPCAYVAIGLLARRSVRSFRPSVWLDGLIGAFAVAGLGTAFVIDPILAGAEGSRSAVIVNAAYPLADLLLLSMVIGISGLLGWRGGRRWLALALGLGLFASADSIYVFRLAVDAYHPGTPLDSMWVVGLAIMAVAAWQPAASGHGSLAGWRGLAMPTGFALAALGLLTAAGVHRVSPVAVVLAACAVALSMARTALAFRELRVLSETRRLAATDELTGLPNRRAFNQALEHAIATARPDGDGLAVLVIDLDHFKELNDTLGHHAGDLALEQVARRLATALRADDLLARLGGDEFAAVLPRADVAVAAAERIARAMEARVALDGIELQLAASVGIALFPEHGDDAEVLLQRADVAMYQAKATRTGHEVYARERDRHTRERLELTGELRDAVAAGELVVHYQPKLDLGTGMLIGVEALVRWPHPVRGMIPPDQFIPLAEQTGGMRQLTAFVLDEAVRQVAAWERQGLSLSVAVNVSATNLLDQGWTPAVRAVLERHDVPPDRLVLEITEDVIMADPERSLAVVKELSQLGVLVSVDDFGTGYSSLGYLKRLPVGELKIDRSFVRELATDAADAAIVQATVDLARRLGISVVAEGVEDAETMGLLAGFGATVAQGYHIARPLPPAELATWAADRFAAPLP